MDPKQNAVLFDFDGTIADSERTLIDALNVLAPEFGFEPIASQELPSLRDKSARELIVSRLHIPLWKVWKIARLERKGRKEFEKRAENVVVFPGIAELISKLRGNLIVGIVSSNSKKAIETILRQADITVDFIHSGSRVFGKTRAIQSALKKHGIEPSHVIYIGDELRDIEACRKIGIRMIAVLWGLNDAAALSKTGVEVATDPHTLLEKIAR